MANLRADIALKKYISLPDKDKPSYNWRDALDDSGDEIIKLNGTLKNIYIIADGSKKISYDPYALASKIGKALTHLLTYQKKSGDVFTKVNKDVIYEAVLKVSQCLSDMRNDSLALQNEVTSKHSNGNGNLKMDDSFTQKKEVNGFGSQALSLLDFNRVVEKVLIDLHAYELATSYLLQESFTKEISKSSRATRTTSASIDKMRVIRRNNQIVSWNASKIEIAIRKSFLSLEIDSAPAVLIVDGVKERVEALNRNYVHIEEIQDIVQEEIMKASYYKVAEAYIIYRTTRNIDRKNQLLEQEKQDATKEQMAIVAVRDENIDIEWDGADLKKRIEYAMMGLEFDLAADEIEVELRRSIYEGITKEDLQKTIILNAKALVEQDADFCLFAGRILLTYIYEEVLDWSLIEDGIGKLKQKHERYFKRYIAQGIKIGRLDASLKSYNIEKLAAGLDPSADMDFDYLGIQTLYDRYLVFDKTSKIKKCIETPQFFWLRVAMGIFIKEDKEKREEKVLKLYGLYKSRYFCSSTPTLFNSGTTHPQLSSCYLYWVDDSIESIMVRGIAENAYLSKWAGGLGGSWTSVRGFGSHIKGTGGESQGVIPFLKMHNDQLLAVNQGGKRRGSGCVYLETWHNDLMEFLELRKNTGDDRRRTHDMETANWIPDLFMKRLEAREEWTFFRANEVKDLHHLFGKQFEKKYIEYEQKAKQGEIFAEHVPAITVWKKMLQMLFETGHPWITFKDPCNVRSPQDHEGVIHSSNLCTEITLNTSKSETAVCNLGSIVIDNHLDAAAEIDEKKLKKTIQIAIRALDNVIDVNFYPTKPARISNLKHRPIGLGVMGLQNLFYKKNISFASKEAVELSDALLEKIAYYAYEASSELAKERGSYSTFKGSKWDRGLLPQDTIELLEKERGIKIDVPNTSTMNWSLIRNKIKKYGMRNSNVLAIAPTATISNIMGSSPCIEPTYKNLYVKSNLSGDFLVLNRYLVKDLRKLNLWNQSMRDNLKYFDGEIQDIENIPDSIKKKYLTAFGVDYSYIIDGAARRQKWIDQSQSVNLWLSDLNIKVLSHMYRSAWSKGIKTTYYLRTLSASNIEKATVALKVQKGKINTFNGKTDDEIENQNDAPTSTTATVCKLGDDECGVCQ